MIWPKLSTSKAILNANFGSGFSFETEVPQALKDLAQQVLNGARLALTSKAILNWFGFEKRSKSQMETTRATFAPVGIRPRGDLPELNIDERILTFRQQAAEVRPEGEPQGLALKLPGN